MRDPDDVREARSVVDDYGLNPCTVSVLPEGTDADTVTRHLRAVADEAISNGFNNTTRLHMLDWGNERGR